MLTLEFIVLSSSTGVKSDAMNVMSGADNKEPFLWNVDSTTCLFWLFDDGMLNPSVFWLPDFSIHSLQCVFACEAKISCDSIFRGVCSSPKSGIFFDFYCENHGKLASRVGKARVFGD